MGKSKSLAQAAASRDPVGVYEALLRNLVRTFSKTSSARDRAALANRIMDVTDKLMALGWDGGDERFARAEVTAFEVIAGKRTERREAAQG